MGDLWLGKRTLDGKALWTDGFQVGFEGNRFVVYWWFVGWDCLQIGLHVCLSMPNIEIHLPFGFVRIGYRRVRDV